jgi:hypothetical protein
MPMLRVLVDDNNKKSSQNNNTFSTNILFMLYFYGNIMDFFKRKNWTSFNRYFNFLTRMSKNGPNWKDTHLYVAPFYFSQDFLRRKDSPRKIFI